MFLRIFPIILILTSLQCEQEDISYLQNVPEEESLEALKLLADFYNSPGKNGQIRDGINLSKCVIPSLSETVEIPPKIPFFYVEMEDGTLLIQYRSRWQKTPDNFIEISLIFAETCNEVHEYVISRFFYSSMPFELRVPHKDESTIAGSISFSGGRRFIRNNIFVEIYAEGELVQMIATVAKDIDELLLTRSTVSSADQFKPVIKRFEIANSLVEYNSQTKLMIDVADPKGSDLYYFWRLTGGGTDKDELGNWYYYAAADPGTNQTITLIVINERGYYCSSSIEVKVKL